MKLLILKAVIDLNLIVLCLLLLLPQHTVPCSVAYHVPAPFIFSDQTYAICVRR